MYFTNNFFGKQTKKWQQFSPEIGVWQQHCNDSFVTSPGRALKAPRASSSFWLHRPPLCPSPRALFRNRPWCSSPLRRSKWQPPGLSGNCANTRSTKSVNYTRPPRGERRRRLRNRVSLWHSSGTDLSRPSCCSLISTLGWFGLVN